MVSHLFALVPGQRPAQLGRKLGNLSRQRGTEVLGGAGGRHITPVWTGSNHDISRFPTRWANGEPDRARCALMLLLTLRGTVFLYEGDEIGMTDVDVPRDQLVDPVGIRFYPYAGRDPVRG